ncbi:hypothetical protein BDW74DRAFT_172635 [Aspergillus multicolor]|uniref:uncharacterized protein n=1 Tax=Aspergillus multicolor TaxID=41759 RepID=UPI003CCDC9DC
MWYFKVLSLPRIQAGRLVLSIPKDVFAKLQEAWQLHPRTTEVFLANTGVLSTFRSFTGGRTCLLMKVANSRTTGFDCVSLTVDPTRRTIYVVYHHLQDEDSVFATLLADLDKCLDPFFFVATLYRSHHFAIESYRNRIDDTIQGIERQTGFGNPGRLLRGRRPSMDMDSYSVLHNPRSIIQQLGYCQTDLAIIGHVARCCLECREWLLQAIDEHKLVGNEDRMENSNVNAKDGLAEVLKSVRMAIREDVEYTRRRTAMLLSQVQQISDRAQNQTSFMLSLITQNDAEYTAAIAIDGKRDSIAMRTISILGIIYLPGTFVATLFSVEMFDWGVNGGGLRLSSSIWVYWAVAVPLTVLTFSIWALWSKRENRKSSMRFMVLRGKTLDSERDAGAVPRSEDVASGEEAV